jgi:membrane protein implicated in regulation of membrane protease activity
VILIIFWIRGTFPRLRIDQLMAFAWQVIVPLSFANILITGIFMYYGWPWWSLTLMSLVLSSVIGYLVYRHLSVSTTRVASVYARQRAAELRRRVNPGRS